MASGAGGSVVCWDGVMLALSAFVLAGTPWLRGRSREVKRDEEATE